MQSANFSYDTATLPPFPSGHNKVANTSYSQLFSNEKPVVFDLVNFRIKKLIAESDVQVYLIQCKFSGKHYALKVFPYEGNNPNRNFQNEIQYCQLIHRNILTIDAVCTNYKLTVDQVSTNISYTIQNYAPHGDFFELLNTKEIKFNDKLIRTYFHQLIKALDYIHQKEVAHLDIKLENLLLSKDFQLLVIDFGLAKPFETLINEPWGSAMYRAPELRGDSYKVSSTADIYSAAIVLFALKSGGHFPFIEDSSLVHNQLSYYEEGANGFERFWEHHVILAQMESQSYDDDFKELFWAMISSDPEKRWTIKDIQQSKWYRQDIYTDSEVSNEMKKLLDLY